MYLLLNIQVNEYRLDRHRRLPVILVYNITNLNYLSSNFALTSVFARFRLLESFNTSLFTTDLFNGTSTEYLNVEK